MAFQGSLESVNLADILQTLAMNRQTGTLSITRDGQHSRHIWFENGDIAIVDAASNDGGPLLLEVMVSKGVLNQAQAEELRKRLYSSRQDLRELLMASNLVPLPELDEVCAWCIEEAVCDLFEWETGSFVFTDGEPADALRVPEIVVSGSVRLPTTSVVMEATRRKDEWGCIWQIISSPDELYMVDNDGRSRLRGLEPDPEELKVLRYLDGRHTIDAIARMVGVSRFDAFAIVARLVENDIARPRSPQDIVADALALRDDGHVDKARALLQNAANRLKVPEVIRPLAEICMEQRDVPEAVALYLDLIQQAQDDGDLPQALADLDIVTEINPQDPDLQLERADVLLELDRISEAVKGFLVGAESYLNSREIKLAVDACHRAKDLEPANPEPHRLLAKAYLLDNQGENAVIEYKSLWHTLLSSMRPRRALEELERILRQDCKFPKVSDQVLGHARGSEAVKTGSALRLLIYLIILMVLGGAGYYGYSYWQDEILVRDEDQKLEAFETRLRRDRADPAALQVLRAEIEERNLTRVPSELRERYGAVHEEVVSTLEDHAETERLQIVARISDAQSSAVLDEIDQRIEAFTQRFQRTAAVGKIEEIRRMAHERRMDMEIAPLERQIRERWESYDWDQALAQLRQLASRDDLPSDIRGRLEDLADEWHRRLHSSNWLRLQGQELERARFHDRAMTVYRRAMDTDDGDATSRERAREAFIRLEQQIISDKRDEVLRAIDGGDRDRIFERFDELQALANQALSREARAMPTSIALPFTLHIDHHHTVLEIRRADDDERLQVTAPEDSSGRWSTTVTYGYEDEVIVTASRRGFDPQRLLIRAHDRRIEAPLVLRRGPTWQADLGGAAITTPIAFQNMILTGTDRNQLVFVSAEDGTTKSLSFPHQVSQFTSDPFIYRGIAYLTLAGQVHAVDLRSSRPLWNFPGRSDDIGAPALGRRGVWVQEHPQKIDELLVFTGSEIDGGIGGGQMVTLGVRQQQTYRYMDSPLPRTISGPPVSIDNVLYIPIGNAVMAAQTDSIGINRPLTVHYTHDIAGEALAGARAVHMGQRKAILITDANGLVIALDANPHTAASERVLVTWLLEEGADARFAPSYDQERQQAYVSLAERGRVIALDLSDDSGRVAWRFPGQSRMGRLLGAPVMGRNGLYIADDAGHLYCIDPTSGEPRWQVDIGNRTTAGLLAHDGRIYIPSRNNLLCFDEGDSE